MAALWFGLLAGMLAVYAVLDGFDFGVGVLHRLVARTDAERRQVLTTIGPVWDGNEVWLIASGGVLFLTFPAAYAAGFSGFYLPLMVVLWLLILRGLSIELRSHEAHPLWRAFWDATLQLASVLMAVVLGAALGNVIRGVPLDASGYFHLPLFGDFSPWGPAGVLDWYTTTIGVLTLAILTLHGALYLVWKAEGPVAARALTVARRTWWIVAVLGMVATALTWKVQPGLYVMIGSRIWPTALVAVALAGYLSVPLRLNRREERSAFLGSVAFILGILGATAAGLYPNILSSNIDPQFSITAQSAQAGGYGLRVALVWWVPGILLAIGYFAHLFWRFRGKVGVGEV
ncbi:MAG TPA: cytochrome d ubiquinol oxidase subunit II [Gemmatimonadales bacterium]|mgnify:CR=1 FL=1|nr:cytochrome d ubiquinol oxidase subunit II [Gemmatimonadales bacterium]